VGYPEGIRDVLSHAVQRLVDQSGVARAKEEQIALKNEESLETQQRTTTTLVPQK
jgi:hypothetical protein